MKMKAFKKELHYLVINCSLPSVCLPVGVSIGLDLIHYFEMTVFPPFLVFSLHPVTKSSLNKEVYRKLIWDHFGVLAFFFSLKSYLLPSTREFSFYHHRTISGLSTNSNSYSCFSSIRTYSWYCHYSPFLSPTSSFVLLYSFCIKLKSHQLALRLFNWKKNTLLYSISC